MSEELHPEVIVTITPNKVSKGQMISIQAYIQDRYTTVPIEYPTIYMEILDEDGVPVWPISAIELESSTISKLISTAELKAGKDYTVRVSPDKSLSPSGTAFFHIDSDVIPAALLVPGAMLIPHVLLPDVVQPETPFKIGWLIYRTQLDSKVCKYCSPLEGNRYRPTDPDLPLIPRHINCRCHYDVISLAEEEELYQAMYQFYYLAEKAKMETMMQVAASAYFTLEKDK